MKEQIGANEFYKTTEQKKESLNSLVAHYARKINNNFSSFYDKEIINDDMSVKTRELFTRGDGGPYAKEEVKKDDKYVKKMEELFAGIIDYDKNGEAIDDNKRIKYLKEICGAKSREGMVAAAKKEEENKHGFIFEKLLLVNLNRILGDKYAVIKSAAYDDYANGADYLVVNYDSGIVACGFDAVNDIKGGERYENKIKKIRRKAMSNGSEIKYGISINSETKDNSKNVVLGKVEHVPIFCLSLNSNELKDLSENMNYQKEEEPSDAELKIFDNLFQKLEAQAVDFKNNKKLNSIVREKLEGFDNFIAETKTVRTEKFE